MIILELTVTAVVNSGTVTVFCLLTPRTIASFPTMVLVLIVLLTIRCVEQDSSTPTRS